MSGGEAASSAVPRVAASDKAAPENSAALVILQTVEDKRFDNLAEVAAYLKTLDAPTRVQYVNNLAVKLVEVQEKVDSHMEYLNNFVEGDEAFKKADPETWKKIEEGANRAKAIVSKKEEAMKRSFAKWGEAEVKRHFGHLLDKGDTTWSKVRRLAMKTDLPVAIVQLRNAVLWRVTNPAPGRNSTTLLPVAADFDRVEKTDQTTSNAQGIGAAGYAISDIGWLIPAERVLSIQEEAGKESERSESPLTLLLEEEAGVVGEGAGDDGGAPDSNLGLRLSEGRSTDDASLDADCAERDEAVAAGSTAGHLRRDDDSGDSGDYVEWEGDDNREEEEEEFEEEGRPSKIRKRNSDRVHKCKVRR